MAIRFKFRSSLNFDSVDIEGRPSISVADLKLKILRDKNLRICEDFDLVFSDAVSGLEYNDEALKIPSGSSVIVKRVPAGSVRVNRPPIASFDNVGISETADAVKASPPANVGTDDFDDFGVDLCPILETTASGDIDADEKDIVMNEKTNMEVPRCLKMPLGGGGKLEASDLSETFPAGSLYVGSRGFTSGKKLDPHIEEHPELEKVASTNPKVMEDADFPSELRCSLCATYFKEAVMIPCCQHSFCQNCIHLVLVRKGRCPKCLSSKCRVEDLLPNISLRQAIDRFINSQSLVKVSDNSFDQYAPDRESGIHAKDMSDAVTIHQRERNLPFSFATGRGSNQIAEEPVGEKLAVLSQRLKQIDGEGHGSTNPIDLQRCPDVFIGDCQGENELTPEEAESTFKFKSAACVGMEGRRSVDNKRHRKVGRTCFMCGSPDHLVKNCPAASNLHPMHQPGNARFLRDMPSYLPHYWNANPFPRPYVYSYGNPDMMPFNSTMLPTTNIPLPTYMPSIFGGMGHMANYRGIERMGGVPAQAAAGPGWHLYYPETVVFQGVEKGKKLPNENLREKDEHASYLKESFTRTAQRSHRKHSKYGQYDDDRERSSSEVEDAPCGSRWHSGEPHEHIRPYSEKYDGRREQRASDYSRSKSYRNCNDSAGVKQMKNDEHERKNYHSQSKSSLEPSLSNDLKTQRRGNDSSYGSRHSRHKLGPLNDEWSNERWQMASGSYDDDKEDFPHYKRKRHY